MTQVSEKGFQAAIIRLLQEVRANSFETNGNIESLGKEMRHKEKQNKNFRIEKYNN